MLPSRRGETTLLRQLLDGLRPGDVLVADSYYGTYWLVAMRQARGVELVMKNHHRRDDHPAHAQPLDKYQRLVAWESPPRPDWMPVAEYQTMPARLTVRPGVPGGTIAGEGKKRMKGRDTKF